MSISQQVFSARINEICTELEEQILAAKGRFDLKLGMLLEVAGDASPEDQAAFHAIGKARLDEMERRMAEGA